MTQQQKKITKTEARRRIRRAVRKFTDALTEIERQGPCRTCEERWDVFGEWLFGVYWGLKGGLKDYNNLYDIDARDMN